MRASLRPQTPQRENSTINTNSASGSVTGAHSQQHNDRLRQFANRSAGSCASGTSKRMCASASASAHSSTSSLDATNAQPHYRAPPHPPNARTGLHPHLHNTTFTPANAIALAQSAALHEQGHHSPGCTGSNATSEDGGSPAALGTSPHSKHLHASRSSSFQQDAEAKSWSSTQPRDAQSNSPFAAQLQPTQPAGTTDVVCERVQTHLHDKHHVVPVSLQPNSLASQRPNYQPHCRAPQHTTPPVVAQGFCRPEAARRPERASDATRSSAGWFNRQRPRS